MEYKRRRSDDRGIVFQHIGRAIFPILFTHTGEQHPEIDKFVYARRKLHESDIGTEYEQLHESVGNLSCYCAIRVCSSDCVLDMPLCGSVTVQLRNAWRNANEWSRR